jgi:hypothetical protein
MTEQEKSSLLREYENTVRRLKEIITSTPRKALDIRPKADYWTIREHVAHLMDCEIFGFTRYRKSIAQPGAAVEGFDQQPWQSDLDYPVMDIPRAMRIIETLHKIALAHLAAITNRDWDEYTITHPERGGENLTKLINRRIEHIKEHIGYINRNTALNKDQEF